MDLFHFFFFFISDVDLFSFLFLISDVDLPAIVGARDQLEVVKGPSNASHLVIIFVFVFVCVCVIVYLYRWDQALQVI